MTRLSEDDLVSFVENLLRAKGEGDQREFLKHVVCDDCNDFVAYLEGMLLCGQVHPRSSLFAKSTKPLELVMSRSLTAGDMDKIPAKDALLIYDSWRSMKRNSKGLSLSDAAKPEIWGALVLKEIKLKNIIPAWFLIGPNMADVETEKTRIGELLNERYLSDEQKARLDSVVRRVLRKLAGARGMRSGNRALFSDCPFAAAWWLGKLVSEIFGKDDEISLFSTTLGKEQVATIMLRNWRLLADTMVGRLTFLCEPEVLAGIVLARSKLDNDNRMPYTNALLSHAFRVLGSEASSRILDTTEAYNLALKAHAEFRYA